MAALPAGRRVSFWVFLLLRRKEAESMRHQATKVLAWAEESVPAWLSLN